MDMMSTTTEHYQGPGGDIYACPSKLIKTNSNADENESEHFLGPRGDVYAAVSKLCSTEPKLDPERFSGHKDVFKSSNAAILSNIYESVETYDPESSEGNHIDEPINHIAVTLQYSSSSSPLYSTVWPQMSPSSMSTSKKKPAMLSEEEFKLQEIVEDLLNMANSFLERKKFETSGDVHKYNQEKEPALVANKDEKMINVTTVSNNTNNSKSKESAAIYEEIVFDNKKSASNTVKSYDSGFFQQVTDEGLSSSLNFQVHSLLDQYDADDEISGNRIVGRSDCRAENFHGRQPVDEKKAALISNSIYPKFKPKSVGSPISLSSRVASVSDSNNDNSSSKNLLSHKNAVVKTEISTDYKGQEIVKSQENFHDFVKKNKADETHLIAQQEDSSESDRIRLDRNFNENSHETCIPSYSHQIHSSNNSTLRESNNPPHHPNLLESHNVGYTDRSMNVSPDSVDAFLEKNSAGIFPLKQQSREFDLKSEDDDANSLLTETLTCAVSASIGSLANTDDDTSPSTAFSYLKGRNSKPSPKKEIITLKPIGVGVQLLENEGNQSPRSLPHTHQNSKTFQGIGYTFHEPRDNEMIFASSVGFYTPQPLRNYFHNSHQPSEWNNHQRKLHINMDSNHFVGPRRFTSDSSSPKCNHPTPPSMEPHGNKLDDFDRSVHNTSSSCSPYIPSTPAIDRQKYLTNHNHLSGQVSEDLSLKYPYNQNRDPVYHSPGGINTRDPVYHSPGINTRDPVYHSPGGINTRDPVYHSPGINTRDPVYHSPGINTRDPVYHSPGINTRDPVYHSPGINRRDPVYRSPGIDSWKSPKSSCQFGSPQLSVLSRPRLNKSSSISSNSITNRFFSPQVSSNSSTSACSPLMSPCFATDQSKHWYRPLIPRDEAIRLLLDAPAGSFIIRNSNMFEGAYGLALKVDKLPVNVKFDRDSSTCLVRHFLIETTISGVRVKGSPIEPTFGSLSTLVYQHMLTPLSLPCKLVLNKFEDDLITNRDFNNNDDFIEDVEGIFIYVNAENTEGLTGQAALDKLVNETFTTNGSSSTFVSKFKVTQVKFKVDKEGLTLTDLERKLFFRKKYCWKYISYSGVETSNRIYLAKDYENRDVSLGRLFCIVTRNPSSPDNTCHLLANKDPENTVLISIIDSINKKISI